MHLARNLDDIAMGIDKPEADRCYEDGCTEPAYRDSACCVAHTTCECRSHDGEYRICDRPVWVGSDAFYCEEHDHERCRRCGEVGCEGIEQHNKDEYSEQLSDEDRGR